MSKFQIASNELDTIRKELQICNFTTDSNLDDNNTIYSACGDYECGYGCQGDCDGTCENWGCESGNDGHCGSL